MPRAPRTLTLPKCAPCVDVGGISAGWLRRNCGPENPGMDMSVSAIVETASEPIVCEGNTTGQVKFPLC